MGQQSLIEIDRSLYFNKSEDELLRQADLYYLKNKFKISTDYNKDKVKHYYLIYRTLNNCECELSNWINLKLSGMLEETKFDKETSSLTPLKYTAVQVINQTFNQDNDHWTEVEW